MRESGLRPVRAIPIALIVALLFTVLFSVQGVLLAAPVELHDVLRIAAWQAVPWFLWAAFALPTFWLLDRLNLGGRSLPAVLGIHLVLGLGLAFVHVVLTTLAAASIGLTASGAPFSGLVAAQVRRSLFSSLVQYALLALGYHLLRTILHFRRSQEIVQQREAQLAAARLEALQRQLQPHFLFNALNAAAAAVRTAGGREAARLIAALGELLRGAIELGNRQEVRLEEELDFLERFLLIQHARFADRLTVHLEVAPETRRAAVPPLLVQTLVENAIKHGLERMETPGEVTVRSAAENGTLHIEVENDGPHPASSRSTENGGTGIGNAQARLHELYGDAAHLSLRARSGTDGVVAAVDLPLREMDQPLT
jgi:two-component system LytT family sensor kinase